MSDAADHNTELLLAALQNPNNSIRQAAEHAFANAKEDPENFVYSLLSCLRFSPAISIRSMAAILIRKLGKDEEPIYEKLSHNGKEILKAQLIIAIQNETEQHIVQKIGDAIGELAAYVLDESEWPEIMTFCLTSIQGGSSALRLSALYVLKTISYYLATSNLDQLSTIGKVYLDCLSDLSLDGQIISAAVTAVVRLLFCVRESASKKKFEVMNPAILNAIASLLNHGHFSAVINCIQALIDLAETNPSFFRSNLANVVGAMIMIAKTEELGHNIRHLAIEFLSTLIETGTAMVRKLPDAQLSHAFITVLFDMMVDVEDIGDAWESQIEMEDDNDDSLSNCLLACQTLDRIALSLKAKRVLPCTFQIMTSYLQNSDWRFRHATFQALSHVGEIIPDDPKQRAMVVQQILTFLNDPHSRVRYAVVNALGQISSEMCPHLQIEQHKNVIPAFMTLLKNDSSNRVKGHALAALTNFTDECSSDLLEDYLNDLLSIYHSFLVGANKHFLEWSIVAIASLADRVGPIFTAYYQTFMPLLKTVFRAFTDKRDRAIRAKALECITLIGLGVGKSVFGVDALEVMSIMREGTRTLTISNTISKSEDPLETYMLQAWTRLCTALGSDFVPYLPFVMPLVFKVASRTVYEEVDDVHDGDSDVELIETADGDVIRVHTEALEDKATALRMLACFVEDLQEDFAPYLEQVINIMSPMITDPTYEGIRDAAIKCMPNITRAARRASGVGDREGTSIKVFTFVLNKLAEALNEEKEFYLMLMLLENMRDVICNGCEIPSDKYSASAASTSRFVYHGEVEDVEYEALLDDAQLEFINEKLLEAFKQNFQRRAVRIAESRMDDADYDEDSKEMDDQFDRMDEQIFFRISEVIGALVKTHGPKYLPSFDKVLLANIFQMANPVCIPVDRKIAIFIFDDLFEYAGPSASKYYSAVIPLMIKYCNDPTNAVRQAAVYGLGAGGMSGGTTFEPYCNIAIDTLTQMVHRAQVEKKTDTVTDNAVSALGRLCEFQSACLDTAKLLPLWLSYLPFEHDMVEYESACSQLCSFIEKRNSHLFGLDMCNMPMVVKVLCESLLCVSGSLKDRVVKLISEISSSIPSDSFHSIISSFPVELQKEVVEQLQKLEKKM